MSEKLRAIVDELGEENILIQTAEEAAELAQACTKLIRARRGNTPVSEAMAYTNLREEVADIIVCANTLGLMMGKYFQSEVDATYNAKVERWYERTFGKREE